MREIKYIDCINFKEIYTILYELTRKASMADIYKVLEFLSINDEFIINRYLTNSNFRIKLAQLAAVVKKNTYSIRMLGKYSLDSIMDLIIVELGHIINSHEIQLDALNAATTKSLLSLNYMRFNLRNGLLQVLLIWHIVIGVISLLMPIVDSSNSWTDALMLYGVCMAMLLIPILFMSVICIPIGYPNSHLNKSFMVKRRLQAYHEFLMFIRHIGLDVGTHNHLFELDTNVMQTIYINCKYLNSLPKDLAIRTIKRMYPSFTPKWVLLKNIVDNDSIETWCKEQDCKEEALLKKKEYESSLKELQTTIKSEFGLLR